jgi:hypothetical protein
MAAMAEGEASGAVAALPGVPAGLRLSAAVRGGARFDLGEGGFCVETTWLEGRWRWAAGAAAAGDAHLAAGAVDARLGAGPPVLSITSAWVAESALEASIGWARSDAALGAQWAARARAAARRAVTVRLSCDALRALSARFDALARTSAPVATPSAVAPELSLTCADLLGCALLLEWAAEGALQPAAPPLADATERLLARLPPAGAWRLHIPGLAADRIVGVPLTGEWWELVAAALFGSRNAALRIALEAARSPLDTAHIGWALLKAWRAWG